MVYRLKPERWQCEDDILQKHTRSAINPISNQPNPPVPLSSKRDIDTAVDAARRASKRWPQVPTKDRKSTIYAYISGLETNKHVFAEFLSREQGKPLSHAMTEIESTIGLARGIISVDIPENVIEDTPGRKIIQRYVPIGVVGAIAPWNYPVLLSMSKIIAAVYTGNTVILKPSPFTPYTGLKLAEMAANYFPPGAVQALSGDDSLGPMMTEHPGIDKISFTGSINTGKKVMANCAKTLKRVTLELGGNDPAIICSDVDIDAIVPKIATCAFLCSGQRCMAIKRLYVHEDIYDTFRDKFVSFVQSLKIGNGTDEDPDAFFGPLQNKMQYERAQDILTLVTSESLTPSLTGGPIDSPGFFFAPVIVENPPDDSRVVTEEPFAPILPLLKWSESDSVSVIDRANNTDTGLGASVWSNDAEKATAMASQLEAGTVWVNTHFELGPTVPFGGHKCSGIGVEYGLAGLAGYCNSQSLWVRRDAAREYGV